MKIIKDKRKELEIKAAILIERKIHEYLKTQSKVVLGIPGGRSVQGIFSLLKHQKIPWEKVHIFMVDERLGKDNQEENFNQAYNSFIEYLEKQKLLLSNNVHPYTYFNIPEKKALEAYKSELRVLSHRYDIVLLSSGEDGHVGSLFPNHDSVNDPSDFFIITENAPKQPPKRLTASRKILQKSQTALLLFFGEEKAKAYKNFLDKSLSIADCPAKLVNDIKDSHVFSDIK